MYMHSFIIYLLLMSAYYYSAIMQLFTTRIIYVE